MTAGQRTQESAGHAAGAVRTPVSALAMELTYACNQSCAYCYNPSRGTDRGSTSGRSAGEPSAEVLLARLERVLSAWDVSLVTLTGGEPLRHPALFTLLDALRVRGIRTQVITNGTLVTETTAAMLGSYSLAAVQITLNGATAEAHRAHVGRDSFQDAIRGAAALIAQGVPVTGCIVVTRNNADQVGAIIEIWRDLGTSCIALSRFSPAGVSLARMQSWLPRRQDLVTAFAQARPYAQAGMPIRCTVPVPACLFDIDDFAPVRFGQCAIGSPFQEFALGPDGSLRLCTVQAGRLAQGRDVLDPDWDLGALPSTREITSYRARLPTFCQGCGAAPICLGGCSASSPYEDQGAPRALDPLIQQYFADEPARLALRLGPDHAFLGVDP